MDNKFYISLEAARLLKEKGYNEDVRNFYDEEGLFLEVEGFYNFEYLTNKELDNNHYAAPTKSEAIDWLESKGVLISPHPVTILHEDGTTKIYWSCHILQKGIWYKTNNLTTRLEAEEAAIIKALELL